MVVRAVELGTVPALGMGLATLVGLYVVQTPPAIVGALQHFAAGILLTTIAKELLPEMVNAQGFAENAASGVGFFSGVGLLILLGNILPSEEEDNDETSNVAEAEADASSIQNTETVKGSDETQTPSMRLRNRRLSFRREAFALSGECGEWTNVNVNRYDGQGEPEATALCENANEHEEEHETTVQRSDNNFKDDNSTAVATNEKNSIDIRTIVSILPTAFLTAIVIDAALDGLLIGISTAIDPTTGPILSASLTVESTFFGITIATALRGRQTPDVSPAILLVASALGPVGLLAGSVAGGSLAPTLVDSPVLLAGLLGFGTSTILFMVAEELLLEAHEEGRDHVWWVDLQLYTGFFASVMVEKLVSL